METEERPGTAFARFMAQKREGASTPPAQCQRKPSLEAPPLKSVAAPAPAAAPGSGQPVQAAQPLPVHAKGGLRPTRSSSPSAWTRPPRDSSSSPSTSARHCPLLLPPPAATSTSNAGSLQAALMVSPATPDFRQLAQAANSLAAAAKALAASPKSGGAFAKTYKKLAQAAADLAVQSASQTPEGEAALAAAQQSAVQHPLQQHPQQPTQHQPVQQQQLQAGKGAGLGNLVPFELTRLGASTPADAASPGAPSPALPSRATPGKVAVPRFPAYNPLIHLRTSDLPPPPGTPLAAGGPSRSSPGGWDRSVSPAAAAHSRPSTSPITHGLADPTVRPVSTSSSARGARAGPHCRLSSGAPTTGAGAAGAGLPVLLRRFNSGPGSAGSAEAQVLVVEARPASAAAQEQRVQEPPPQQVDPLEFTVQHADRVRMAPFPPSTPLPPNALQEDDLSRRYNDAVGRLREKILMREPQQVLKAFKAIDTDNSGDICTAEFRAVVKRMDFGVNDVDDKVLDMIADAMDSDQDGVINFAEFLSAVRFNKIQYRPYHKSFYHKTTGNPDVPIGGTTLSYCPWGTLKDVEHNTQRHLNRHEDRLQEVRQSFQAQDSDSDGVVDYRQFRAALKDLDQKFDLKFSDEYIEKMFREADKSYSKGVRYEDLLGGPGQTTAEGHFTTEFLKPKKLRSSQLLAPWEWRLSPRQAQAELLAASTDTLTRLGTASGGRPQRV